MPVHRALAHHRALLLVNLVAAAVSTASCVAGVIDPALPLPHGSAVTGGVSFYAQAYAVRALPLGVALVHQLLAGRSRPALLALLLVAGAAQVGDAAIGLSLHNPGMTTGASLLAVVHLATAARLGRTGAVGAAPVGPAADAAASATSGRSAVR